MVHAGSSHCRHRTLFTNASLLTPSHQHMSAALRAAAAVTANASSRTTTTARMPSSGARRRARPACWVGLDGTPKGWSAAVLDESGSMTVLFLPTLACIWRIQRRFTLRAIAVDMPLALPMYAESGGRGCERVARKILSQAKKRAGTAARSAAGEIGQDITWRSCPFPQPASHVKHLAIFNPRAPPPYVGHTSIFSPPSRAALAAFVDGATHAECSSVNRSAGREELKESRKTKGKAPKQPALGLSRQTYYIMPKMVELEAFVASAKARDAFTFTPSSMQAEPDKIALFECHPEMSFLAMASRHDAVTLRNDIGALYSKLSKAGLAQRLLLIQADEVCASFGSDGEKMLQRIAEQVQAHSSVPKSAKKNVPAVQTLAQLSSWQSFVVDADETDAEPWSMQNTKGVPTNDAIDAMACALAAHRFHSERCIAIREESEDLLDHRGIPMTMYA